MIADYYRLIDCCRTLFFNRIIVGMISCDDTSFHQFISGYLNTMSYYLFVNLVNFNDIFLYVEKKKLFTNFDQFNVFYLQWKKNSSILLSISNYKLKKLLSYCF